MSKNAEFEDVILRALINGEVKVLDDGYISLTSGEKYQTSPWKDFPKTPPPTIVEENFNIKSFLCDIFHMKKNKRD